MSTKIYREIPSVQEILLKLGNEYSVHQNYVVRIIRNELAQYRKLAKQGKNNLTRNQIINKIVNSVNILISSSLKNIINGTGIVLHTNLGRAPFDKKLIQRVAKKLSGYTNFEVDLQSGKRGNRLAHISEMIGAITGTDGGIVVNNNAAAVLLTLNTFADGKEVIVSRGQEVEIGDSFRIPEVVQKSSCTLIEVGTTNRTHLIDYERAINKNTAVLLWVHTSNYVVKGFTKTVTLKDLAELGRRKRIPVIADLGSGVLINFQDFKLPDEISVQQAVKSGISLATFSGDKLMGGPQSGIIVGKKSLLKKVKNNPLYRALRCDKQTIAVLDEILRTYNSNGVTKENLVNTLLQSDRKKLYSSAEKLLLQVRNSIKSKWNIEIVNSMVEAGSGSLPEAKIESVALQFSNKGQADKSKIEDLAKQFRLRSAPIIGYINKGMFYIDLKAILPEQYSDLIDAINEL